MVPKTAVWSALIITLFGCLGGWLVAVVMPTRYYAEADVVVYEMPPGLTELLSPDEATNISAIYQAGMFQPQVVERIQTRFPQLTVNHIKASISIQLVAYTPLTRVVAMSSSPEEAVQLANVAATSWTEVTGQAMNDAYNQAKSALIAHDDLLFQQMLDVQNKLANRKISSAEVAALQDQASALADEYRNTDAAIVQLDTARFDVAGNAYVSVPATLSTTVMTPDPLKTVLVGAAVGFAVGFVLALWVTRRSYASDEFMGMLSPEPRSHEVTYGE